MKNDVKPLFLLFAAMSLITLFLTGFPIILIVYMIAVFISFFLFMRHKYKKLDEITEYIKKIESGIYLLDMKDNTESEFSKLKSELYKITIMLREQSELSKLEKVNLSNAISDISHQIKTPITSLMIMTDILYTEKSLSREKQEEFLKEMQEQLAWIKDLVLSLLKLSKLDSGVTELKQEEVNVESLIREVIKNLSIPIEIKKQEVEVSGSGEVSFLGDFYWTKEAILNIVKNGIEHTPENGRIVISFLENMLYTEIRIKDNGPGILKEDLAHIFERFYKARNSEKDSIGIGLSISKTIVEKQNGKIYVNVNDGTEFKMQFFK